MSPFERKYEIMKILCRRRHETIDNLAAEFKVSSRTIQRDIDFLSLNEPIYTQYGRYGGVYIVDGYSMDRMYMSDDEIGVLQKLYLLAEVQASVITYKELCTLKSIISLYSKPKIQNERIKQ